MMFSMLISLILMCHTWILHHHGSRPRRLTVEASGPHHDMREPAEGGEGGVTEPTEGGEGGLKCHGCDRTKVL